MIMQKRKRLWQIALAVVLGLLGVLLTAGPTDAKMRHDSPQAGMRHDTQVVAMRHDTRVIAR